MWSQVKHSIISLESGNGDGLWLDNELVGEGGVGGGGVRAVGEGGVWGGGIRAVGKGGVGGVRGEDLVCEKVGVGIGGGEGVGVWGASGGKV